MKMHDRDMLLMAYGGLKSLEEMDDNPLIKIIEVHLFGPEEEDVNYTISLKTDQMRPEGQG